MGLAATGLGLHTVVKNMSNSIYPVLFIISLAIGGLLGTTINSHCTLLHWNFVYSRSN